MKKLKNDRGAIFLETALVMPIFLILLCLCVDIPRIIQVRQKIGGAGRLIAEVRARNNGDYSSVIDESSLKSLFFDASETDIKLNIEN